MDSSSYCRLCAKTEKKPLISVLESNPLNVKEKLKNLLQIKVFEGTKLPKQICLECLTKLNQFNEFFTFVKEQQVILEIIFGEKSESPEKEHKTQPEDQNVFIIEEFSAELPEHQEEEVKEESFARYESMQETADDSHYDVEEQTPLNSSSAPKKRKFDRFDCYVCSEQLPSNTNFIEHFKESHPTSEILYTCYLCTNSVKKYRSYTRHIESHSEKRFACDVCDRNFSQKITLVQHLNSHSSIKSYKCEDCGLDFKQNSSLFKHRKQKHSSEMTMCSECHKAFVNNETLQQHMRSRHGAQREITCVDCSKTFASRSALLYHRSSQHEEDHGNHICKICNKRFRTLIILKRHLKKFHILN